MGVLGLNPRYSASFLHGKPGSCLTAFLTSSNVGLSFGGCGPKTGKRACSSVTVSEVLPGTFGAAFSMFTTHLLLSYYYLTTILLLSYYSLTTYLLLTYYLL